MSDPTLIDRMRLDQFNGELLAFCKRWGFLLTRLRASEDHGIDVPEVDIELKQVDLPPEPFAIPQGLMTSVVAPDPRDVRL